MFKRWIGLLLIASCLAGCVTNGTFCDIAKPITVSKQDVLTDGTASQIVEHDLKGSKLCGW